MLLKVWFKYFQASVHHDNIVWGDRKLNVAPAVKRNNIHNSVINKTFFFFNTLK